MCWALCRWVEELGSATARAVRPELGRAEGEGELRTEKMLGIGRAVDMAGAGEVGVSSDGVRVVHN